MLKMTKTKLMAVKPARKGDHLILIAYGNWGKGATIEEAYKNLRAVCGKIGKGFLLYSVDSDAYVTGMGGLNTKQGHPAMHMEPEGWSL
jgi:hypothetical protein